MASSITTGVCEKNVLQRYIVLSWPLRPPVFKVEWAALGGVQRRAKEMPLFAGTVPRRPLNFEHWGVGGASRQHKRRYAQDIFFANTGMTYHDAVHRLCVHKMTHQDSAY